MSGFWSIVQEAQNNELQEADKVREEERKKQEALRKANHPGTISGRELFPRIDDEEEKVSKKRDADERAALKKEAEQKEDANAQSGPFPPPPSDAE